MEEEGARVVDWVGVDSGEVVGKTLVGGIVVDKKIAFKGLTVGVCEGDIEGLDEVGAPDKRVG